MRILLSTGMLAVLLFNSCSSGRQYSSRPHKGSGEDDVAAPDVRVTVFHKNDTVSSVHVCIENENLLYKRPDSSGVFYGHLRVHCQLLVDGNPRKVLDSASVTIFDRAGAGNVPLKRIYRSFELSALFGNNYLLAVEVFDLNRRSRYRTDVQVNKSSRVSSQNFLVTRNDSVMFRDHFLSGERLDVKYADSSFHTLYAESFLREFGPAPPPFSTREPDPVKFRPDTVYLLQRTGEKFSVGMPPQGFVHLRAEQALDQGLTLLTFDESFPGVSSNEEMINCARYIMSREEFDRCKSATDMKKAIDGFWQNIGGSNERARELLRRYYNRVKEANRQFSSYTQGWKTDRGMIFIVFGRPVNVYKSRKDEIWVYGNEANPATLRFVFNKTPNPYSENDFVMERSQFYKEPWHTAVDFWRQGHVYLERRR